MRKSGPPETETPDWPERVAGEGRDVGGSQPTVRQHWCGGELVNAERAAEGILQRLYSRRDGLARGARCGGNERRIGGLVVGQSAQPIAHDHAVVVGVLRQLFECGIVVVDSLLYPRVQVVQRGAELGKEHTSIGLALWGPDALVGWIDAGVRAGGVELELGLHPGLDDRHIDKKRESPGEPDGEAQVCGADREQAMGGLIPEVEPVGTLPKDTGHAGVDDRDGGEPIASQGGTAKIGEVVLLFPVEKAIVGGMPLTADADAHLPLGYADGRELR